jgi:hypothetical protein
VQDQSLVAESRAFFALEEPIGPYPDGAPECEATGEFTPHQGLSYKK